jgi:Phosphopantetheine attachment site.
MIFTKDEAVRQIIESLKSISPVAGDVVITLDLNPLESLALDSGDGVEFALDIEDRLAIKIPMEVNPLVKDGAIPRARTVGEIADFLTELAAKHGETQK